MNQRIRRFQVGFAAVALFGLAATAVQAQWHYYYYFKQKQPLTLDVGRVAMLRPAGFSTVEDARGLKPAARLGIDETAVEPWPIKGWYLAGTAATMKTPAGVQSIVSQISTQQAADFVSPVFVGEDGGPIIITPDILVGFKPSVDPARAEAILAENVSMEPPVPLPPNVEPRRVVVMAGPGEAVAAEPSLGVLACEDDPSAVYCNTLGRWAFSVSGAMPGLLLADDIATTAVAGCNLDRYVIMVTGDKDGDGSGVGPYDVEVALYDACPSAGGSSIRGTAAHRAFPDNGVYRVEVIIDAGLNIPIPANLYLGVSFSRLKAGTVVGAPATVGFSADSLDSPHTPCWGWFGGFPNSPHASIYAEIYVRDDCPNAFVGYKNSNHARNSFSPGGGIPFADDIRLGVRECDMIAYEVTVKGSGRTDFHLRRFLTEEMIPGTDAFIVPILPGGFGVYRVEIDPPISLPQILFIVFETSSSDVGPILTGKQAGIGSSEDLYWIYDGILWIPHSETVHSAFDVSIWCAGLPAAGACCDMIFTEQGACVGGVNHGEPCAIDDHCPGGVCVGEAVCRELPEMNCPYPDLWEEGAMCESACEGGDNDGQPCTRQADCPGGNCWGGPHDEEPCDSDDYCDGWWCRPAECPGPFRRPCGQSACCTPDGPCVDLTEKQCFELEPVGYDPQRYQQGSFCGVEGQWCPRPPCIGGEGPCKQARESYCVGGDRDGLVCDPYGLPAMECEARCVGGSQGAECSEVTSTCVGGPRDGEPCDEPGDCGQFCWYPFHCPDGECVADCPGVPGCEDPFCCKKVCQHLPWCCETHWGPECAAAVWLYCVKPDPSNNTCETALLVEVPSITESDGIKEVSPPPPQVADFCCNVDGPDSDVFGTVWYKFVATDTSARLSTCCSVPRLSGPADDSLVQVFSVGVDDPDAGICNDRSPCSISEQDCADGSTCVMDDQRACDKLNPIACNDDGLGTCTCGGFPEPTRSRLCVKGLVVGHTYYVMVAGAVRWEWVPEEQEFQWVEHRGVYKLQLTSPCVPPVPPLHNDICEDAESITGDNVVVPFALATGFCNDGTPCTLPGPDCSDGSDCFEESFATWDCPTVCLHNPETMQNDVWFDWTPLSSGVATIETCGEDDMSTPNTTMVVYEGCDCPARSWLDCEDYASHPGCLSGSRVAIYVVKGSCYKIRVGGWAGNTAPCLGSSEPCIGNLSIAVDAIEDCNWNGIPDECDISCGAPGGPCYVPDCGQSEDCQPNGIPDECEPDTDGDGANDDCDNCPFEANIKQIDSDRDGVGDVCDNCRERSNGEQRDSDFDSVGDLCDNCPNDPNARQSDFDEDGIGDACDDDIDNDGVSNAEDVCVLTPLGAAVDEEGRSLGDIDGDCDTDLDDFSLFQRGFTGPGD